MRAEDDAEQVHTIDVGYVHVLRDDTPEGVSVCVENCPHPMHQGPSWDGPMFYDPEVTSHEH